MRSETLQKHDKYTDSKNDSINKTLPVIFKISDSQNLQQNYIYDICLLIFEQIFPLKKY